MKKKVVVKKAVIKSARLVFEDVLAQKMPPINCVVTVLTEEFKQPIDFCVANSSEAEEETYQLLDLCDLLGTFDPKKLKGKKLQVLVCYDSVYGPEYIYALGVAGKYIIPRVNISNSNADMEQQYYTEEEVRAVIDKEEYC